MISIEKFNTVKNIVESIINILYTNGLLPEKETFREGTSIVDWTFNHIKQKELDSKTIDEIENAYYQILNNNPEFLQVAQSFFADATFIQRLQATQGVRVDTITTEISENIALIINSMWGLIAYFPFLVKYLRTREEWLEEGVRRFITALIVNIQAQLQLGRAAEKVQEIIQTVATNPEERILN